MGKRALGTNNKNKSSFKLCRIIQKKNNNFAVVANRVTTYCMVFSVKCKFKLRRSLANRQ